MSGKGRKKAILYEAYLEERKPFQVPEEEIQIGEVLKEGVKRACGILWHMFLFIMVGIAVVALMDNNTRSALLQLLSNI